MVAQERLTEVVESVLDEYAAIPYSYGEIERQTVFDREKGRFLLMIDGWENERRIHGNVIDVRIKDNKICILRDGTEDGLAPEFVRLGIPKSQIVLAWYPEEMREDWEYAVR